MSILGRLQVSSLEQTKSNTLGSRIRFTATDISYHDESVVWTHPAQESTTINFWAESIDSGRGANICRGPNLPIWPIITAPTRIKQTIAPVVLLLSMLAECQLEWLLAIEFYFILIEPLEWWACDERAIVTLTTIITTVWSHSNRRFAGGIYLEIRYCCPLFSQSRLLLIAISTVIVLFTLKSQHYNGMRFNLTNQQAFWDITFFFKLM